MHCCLRCRDSHLKCDATLPKCYICEKSGKDCTYPTAKPKDIFRHGLNPSRRIDGEPGYGERDLTFSPDQVWVGIPSELVFEDSTEEVTSNYLDSSENRLTPLSSVYEESDLTAHPTGFDGLDVPSAISYASESTVSNSSARLLNFGQSAGRLPQSGYAPDCAISRPLNSVSISSPGHTIPRLLSGESSLSHITEGFLLRHFSRVVGPWLDLCDDERHFALDVVRRAPTCPLLLNACLALSARQLARTQSFSSETADYYRGHCIEILIPLLSNPALHQDIDVMLASIVILRLEEQISCTKHEDDFQRHLLGGSAFVNSRIDWYLAGGLTEASFWAFVMQDIQFSLAWQTPLRLCFEPFNDELDRVWHAERSRTEKSWVHRAIWLLAQTVQYCATERGDKSKTEWEMIQSRLDEWEMSRPQAFTPFFYRAADPEDEKPLPTIWFSSSLHVCAMQHICMARALLITCDPSRPRFGLDYGKYQRRQQEHVTEYLKLLFGAAASTDDVAARHMIPIALCASFYWISGRNLQRQILDLAHVVGEETGWEWTEITEKLKGEWGWSPEEGLHSSSTDPHRSR